MRTTWKENRGLWPPYPKGVYALSDRGLVHQKTVKDRYIVHIYTYKQLDEDDVAQCFVSLYCVTPPTGCEAWKLDKEYLGNHIEQVNLALDGDV